MKSTDKESIFDELGEGLEASIHYSKGALSLRSVTLPAPPPVPSPVQIVRLRTKYRLSQPIFAAALNVSSKTVQAWEQGQRVPSHASVRLLQIFEEEPEVVVRMVGCGIADAGVKGLNKARMRRKTKASSK
jgi:putative transcriptional regulator